MIFIKLTAPILLVVGGYWMIKRAVKNALLGPASSRSKRKVAQAAEESEAADAEEEDRSADAGHSGQAEESTMDPCPQCKLYVSRESAYTRSIGGQKLQFCGKRCAGEFAAAQKK